MKHSTYALVYLLIVLFASPTFAVEQATLTLPQTIAYKKPAKSSLKMLAQHQYNQFKSFLDQSLYGKGKATFQKMSAQVKTNIHWRNGKGKNDYNEAFRRSHEFFKSVDLHGMPPTILLLAYMESQWQGKRGKKAADYGYWQLTPEVLREIQTLDYVPKNLRKANLNTLREDPNLSTMAALVHLRRYYFYFSKVAGYSESDAWLLTFTSFNWGAGNVKRMLAEMQRKGIKADFSNFYDYLYNTYQKNKGDRSMKAAVQYVPSLWNIAQLLKSAN